MKVFDLACDADHRFEGWFASAGAFDDQSGRGLIECPVCGSRTVRKLLSAPRLNLRTDPAAAARDAARPDGDGESSSGRAPLRDGASPSGAPVNSSGAPSASGSPSPQDVALFQKRMLQFARRLIESTEDVGPRFAEEARRIHYAEAPERAIRGQATPQEAEALRDEGIEVFSLPLPAALKGPVQ
ncbi:MAG: DUF1178 family protein [Lautropia sp.]